MILRVTATLGCCLLMGLSAARAHFVWIDVVPADSGRPQAVLYFSETPEPGEPHLIGKIGHTKAWTRTADGTRAPLKPESADEGTAALPLAGPVASGASVEAMCDYGVYERGPAGLLLQYYAKRLSGDWAKHGDKLARSPELALDVVPNFSAGKLRLQVLYKDQPSGGSEVVIVDPAGELQELKTDAQGRAETELAGPGRYAVRAAHIEADRAGKRGDKAYDQTWHYCTLLVDVGADAGVATPSAKEAGTALSAADALQRARDGRAVWDDEFPGFAAQLTASDGKHRVAGRATIDAYGVVELEMAKSPLSEWVDQQLSSMVQHRMPAGEVSEGDVTFADEDAEHPLGRLIHLGDADLDSAYRIKDDVIMEVNRSAGPASRFTISVLEIVRNAEKKYLPRAFTMSFYDSKSGALQQSLGYWNQWHRVGNYDLPKTILEVSAHPGGTSTRQIEFSNWTLTK